MVAAAVEAALEALFFGSVWYFGILIFMVIALTVMKLWKYAGALVIPMVIALEVAYYERLNVYGNYIWAMIALLFLALIMAIYPFMKKGD